MTGVVQNCSITGLVEGLGSVAGIAEEVV